MRKTLSGFYAALALGAALVTGCGLHPRQTGHGGSTLRVGFISSNGGPPTGPEGWLYRKGEIVADLAPAGITGVTFTPFPNGPDLNEAMAANAIDLGMVGDTPGIVARAAGVQTRLINQTGVNTNAWLVTRADGPKSVEELRGKTVATAKGSYMARYLLGLLAEKGLSKDVRFVHLLPSDSEAALRRGDIAAYASPYGPVLQSHGLRIIDQANQHPGLSGSGVTVITAASLAAHPSLPTVWNRMRTHGISDIQAHSDDYYKVNAEALRLSPAIYKAVYPIDRFDPQPLTPAGLALLNGTKAFLVQQRLAKKDFSISDWSAIPPPSMPGADAGRSPRSGHA